MSSLAIPSGDDDNADDWQHFLRTAVPLMEAALDEKVESRVFDEYIYVQGQGEGDEMQCTHELPFPKQLADAIKARTNGTGPGGSVMNCSGVLL